MGKRGPARTPTKILKIRGAKRAIYRNPNEPDPPAGYPDPPYNLNEVETEMWFRLVTDLDSMGVLTVIDGNALARYCTTWKKWRKCEDFCEKHGEVCQSRTKNGEKISRKVPQADLAIKYADQLLRLEQQFGLTPAARSGIEVNTRTVSSVKKSKYFPKARVDGA